RIGDKAAVEPFRTARHAGHGGRDPATGARFGGGQHPAACAQPGADLGGQLLEHPVCRVHPNNLTSTASASKAYAAATMSSIITPKPPLNAASTLRTGGGLTMSKKRNSATATACHSKVGGVKTSTSQIATISSHTMAP